MMKIFKKAVLVSCILALALSMTACAKKEEPLAIPDNASTVASGLISGISQMDDAGIASFQAQDSDKIEEFFKQYNYTVDGTAFLSGLESWQSAKEEMGGITEVGDPVMTSDKDSIVATIQLKGKTHNADCVVTMDDSCAITAITVNVDYSLGEDMERAALNTVLGMGSTFIILIFLSIIIGLFVYIPKIQAAFEGKKAPKQEKAAAVENTISQIIEKEELTDDSELVAVISAAVAAYEASNGGSTSGDGFVVRSIRRHFD